MHSTTTKPIPADGSPLACDAGSHTINLQRTIENGFTMRVTAGPSRVDELTDSFNDETLARHAARTIAARLKAGEHINTLIAEKQAAQAELIAAVNASMDQATAEYIAPRQAARNIGVFADTTRVNTRFRKGPLSEPMKRALALANPAGEIRVQPGVAPVTLKALALANLGRTVPSTAGGHDIVKLALNLNGLRMAEQIRQEAKA